MRTVDRRRPRARCCSPGWSRRWSEERPDGVLSFGVAGALSPDLATGELVVAGAVVHAGGAFDSDPPWTEALARRLKARESTLACADAVGGPAKAKSALREATGAALVDMESGVAAARVPCAGHAVRGAARHLRRGRGPALPPSAVAGMGPEGEVRVGAVVRSAGGAAAGPARPGARGPRLRRPRSRPCAAPALRSGRRSASPARLSRLRRRVRTERRRTSAGTGRCASATSP